MAEDNKNEGNGNDAAIAAQSGLEDMVKREDQRSALVGDNIEAARKFREEEREALAEPAEFGGQSASKLESSGAFIEEGAKKMVDVKSPAVDNNPRAGTTVAQNRIDFNDPTANDRQAVERRLSDQSGTRQSDDES